MRLSLVIVILLLILPGLTGCYKATVGQYARITKNVSKKSPEPPARIIIDVAVTDGFPELLETTTDKVYSQYQEWKGIRYMRGGMSKQGIDCSGLTCIIYLEKFGIILPRTAREQAGEGVQIKRSELASGDLVFFKTGKRSYHVGIYIEDGKFLHVSTSSGVMISTLNEKYWKGHYWQSRRI